MSRSSVVSRGATGRASRTAGSIARSVLAVRVSVPEAWRSAPGASPSSRCRLADSAATACAVVAVAASPADRSSWRVATVLTQAAEATMKRSKSPRSRTSSASVASSWDTAGLSCTRPLFSCSVAPA